MINDPRIAPPELFAWVGEDELGSGQVGIKQGFVPAGCIALVSVDHYKLTRPSLTDQLHSQVRLYGKTIRLVKYVAVEIMEEIER